MRHFFAVWPDAQSAAALAALSVRLADEAGGKPVRAEKIHLTLAFLGAIPESVREAAIDAADATRGDSFSLAVDTMGSFRRARVAWVGISAPPPPLMRLQSALAAALASRGLELEDRPYAPHVTLARNVARPVATRAMAPIAWRVDAFTLVRSETGKGTYVVERRWELGN
jgi:2'-5' RNA ligase